MPTLIAAAILLLTASSPARAAAIYSFAEEVDGVVLYSWSFAAADLLWTNPGPITLLSGTAPDLGDNCSLAFLIPDGLTEESWINAGNEVRIEAGFNCDGDFPTVAWKMYEPPDHFGTYTSGVGTLMIATVPEPPTLVLLATVLLATLRRHHHR